MAHYKKAILLTAVIMYMFPFSTMNGYLCCREKKMEHLLICAVILLRKLTTLLTAAIAHIIATFTRDNICFRFLSQPLESFTSNFTSKGALLVKE